MQCKICSSLLFSFGKSFFCFSCFRSENIKQFHTNVHCKNCNSNNFEVLDTVDLYELYNFYIDMFYISCYDCGVDNTYEITAHDTIKQLEQDLQMMCWVKFLHPSYFTV